MTVKQVMQLGLGHELIKDDTEVWIRDEDLRILAHGKFNQDDVVKYLDRVVECFTWQDDDNFYIDVK